MGPEDARRRPNPRVYIAVGVLMVALMILMASTGPEPEVEVEGSLTRVGGTCLQLEQWALFGWDIVGQTYSASDVEKANWYTPPSSNPPCDDAPEAEYLITLPADSDPDVYRVCGLADERGCIEFTLQGSQ